MASSTFWADSSAGTEVRGMENVTVVTQRLHPAAVLFSGEKPFPLLPAVDHYAGSETLIRKALVLQGKLGPVFDVTCDCEDGAPASAERAHAQMCAAYVNSEENRYGRVGIRIHGVEHTHWREDLEIIVPEAGERIAYITLPKARGVADVATQIEALRKVREGVGLRKQIPVHVLIETHGALREAWEIAQLPEVESLDLGLMDFVSGHHGAIPTAAMKSPGQFEHLLVARAKCEVAAAALGNGVVPTHNITTELKDTSLVYYDARRARQEFGFLRMWSIHPNQIDPILTAMRPDFSEIEAAAEILLAAQAIDWAPIRHKGQIHDRASYRSYWELLQRASVTGVQIPSVAIQAFFSTDTPHTAG